MPAALDDNPGLYMLVAGAFSVEANAQVLANDLVANGFDAQVFEQDGGLHIVTYATHLDEQAPACTSKSFERSAFRRMRG